MNFSQCSELWVALEGSLEQFRTALFYFGLKWYSLIDLSDLNHSYFNRLRIQYKFLLDPIQTRPDQTPDDEAYRTHADSFFMLHPIPIVKCNFTVIRSRELK